MSVELILLLWRDRNRRVGVIDTSFDIVQAVTL
jgi:hypothetical protein